MSTVMSCSQYSKNILSTQFSASRQHRKSRFVSGVSGLVNVFANHSSNKETCLPLHRGCSFNDDQPLRRLSVQHEPSVWGLQYAWQREKILLPLDKENNIFLPHSLLDNIPCSHRDSSSRIPDVVCLPGLYRERARGFSH